MAVNNTYFVDGYDALTCTVYEFHGCLYATPDRTVEELHQATLNKRMALLRAGYTVIEMWECQWDCLVETEPAVSQFLRLFDLAPPLEPHEAFFGGRTGVVALHAVAGECGEIRYVDVTSLYPWVNKSCPYPICHLQIIIQPVDQSIGSYFGIATVLTFFHLLACFTLSCPYVVVTNSHFPSAVLASKRSRRNRCWLEAITVITRTRIGCYAVLGAPPSWL